MSSAVHADRLARLRAELKARGLDGFVVPISDEHMSEYVGAYAQRLAWLTGFGGSAGTAAVLPEKAAIFVDGRYTVQVRDQVDGTLYDYVGVPQSSVAEWLGANVGAGQRIGYDPWLHGIDWARGLAHALAAKGAELVAVDSNPVDAVWDERPAPSAAPVTVHDTALAGQSAADKRAIIADWLKAKGLDTTVMTALDSIAWTFNIRGTDVTHTPVGLAFALLHADATADLFIAPEKITEAVRAHLGNSVRIHDRDAFEAALAELAGKKVAVDPDRAVAAIFTALEGAGARIERHRDPAVLPKAIKNDTELGGTRAAHVRDGVAVARFLKWMEAHAPQGGLDELSAAAKLRAFREESGALRDLSFDTISAAGPNGALPHYKVDETTNRAVETGTLYLVDSGGQYADGTTDITRTIAIGRPTAEMRRRFTQVLKGHIALATARFPKGTRGSQLDILARQYLWADGVDYAHGTGHGVGAYLAVHEGPQRIAKPSGGQAGTEEPLHAGMILSNEPGYYKAGHFGIRIENLVIVVPQTIAGAEEEMLGFETITFAPIARDLVEGALLSPAEADWLDAYHAQVLEKLAPGMDEADRAWLAAACAPIDRGAAALAA
ncbi:MULTISPECIES: aminopeptidase P family protein [Sphingopyxis]|uniref:aminopeptidase P family protein n=1 Tax=Sphingopyxis TaxID=165697 RepID=UPI00086CEA76|nr:MULTISPECIES: aminopeptidase P family protein [Sphingopyxis]APW71594.1 X-Pro aminopeptidase [Sphingopyxis granuli]AVA15544.1 aminopeptidase P family protein [Sphingopyxis sp. MG]ODU28135.1 MAG: X-Pro aminopeptidase [Sphingopyxis sp. SCN 67-31]